MRLTSLKALALPVAAVFATVACGGGGTTGGGSSKGTIVIASDYPASGGEASTGIPEQQAVAFAVSQHQTIKGFTIQYKPFDDAINGVHDPQKGAQNATTMAGDSSIVAMVGPNNSNVAKAMIPILAAVPLAMVSPANTNECLTKSFSYCNPAPSELRKGSTNNYFRIAGTDDQQGPAMAVYAHDTLKFTKAAIFSDNETFGKGVADNFQKKWTSLGGTVVVRNDYDAKNTSDFKTYINSAKSGGAQFVYIGATKPTRAQVRDAIAKTKDFKGITGTWTFDQNGDITTPVFSYYQSDPTNTATGGWKYLSSQGVTSSS